MSALPAPQHTSSHWWSRSKRSKDRSPLPLDRSHPPLPNEYETDKLVDPSHKQPSKLNTLASVMGLKSKKHTITIQDPPSTSSRSPYSSDPYVPPYNSRPHSKAVSTTTSDDGFEPRTPSDIRLSCPRSIMTMSDPDPFASNGVIVPPHFDVQDSSRLSVLSNGSLSKRSVPGDTAPRHSQYYGPSLSKDHQSPNQHLLSGSSLSEPSSPLLTNLTTRALMVRTVSEGNNSVFPREDTVVSAPFMPRSSSVKPRDMKVSTPTTPGARPLTRPRGKTDVGPSRYRKNSTAPPFLVLVRQPSLSFMTVSPPNSPPTQELPPVPPLDQSERLTLQTGVHRTPSSSSSSLSFAQSEVDVQDNQPTTLPFGGYTNNDRGLRALRERTREGYEPTQDVASPRNGMERASPAKTTNLPVEPRRVLKNAASHHSLHRTESLTISTHAEDPLGYPYASLSTPARGPKKQRSFPHPRMPLPTLRHVSSFTPSETSSSIYDTARDKEKEKRECATPPTRRRLFPGAMRRSSSSHMNSGLMDDDSGSVFSLFQENDRSTPSSTNFLFSPGSESTVAPPVSFCSHEPSSSSSFNVIESPRPPETPVDYMPQQIMSPVDMLKLEAMIRANADSGSNTTRSSLKSVDGESSLEDFGFSSRTGRPRGSSVADSLMSESTAFSGAFSERAETSSIILFDQHAFRPGNKTDSCRLISPVASQGQFPSETTKSAPQLKQSTSHGTIKHHSSIIQGDFQSPHGNSLPPPPRPRPTVHQYQESMSSKRSSVALIQPLSPPPIRRNKSAMSTHSTKSTASSQSEQKSPPPSFNNGVPRRSIMKKPSFLEIEDEVEADMGARNHGINHRKRSSSSPPEDSFLDLGRGENSFDTIRTASTESGSG